MTAEIMRGLLAIIAFCTVAGLASVLLMVIVEGTAIAIGRKLDDLWLAGCERDVGRVVNLTSDRNRGWVYWSHRASVEVALKEKAEIDAEYYLWTVNWVLETSWNEWRAKHPEGDLWDINLLRPKWAEHIPWAGRFHQHVRRAK